MSIIELNDIAHYANKDANINFKASILKTGACDTERKWEREIDYCCASSYHSRLSIHLVTCKFAFK